MTHQIPLSLSRWLAFLLGALLIVVAVLKMSGKAIDPVADLGIFSDPWFHTFVIGFELLLGLWLLSGWEQVGAWVLSLLTFTVFAGFSFYSGWVGEASCGCFGVIQASPWWAFGIDVAALILLLMARPGASAWQGLGWQECCRHAQGGLVGGGGSL